jgi:hypothetical protein
MAPDGVAAEAVFIDAPATQVISSAATARCRVFKRLLPGMLIEKTRAHRVPRAVDGEVKKAAKNLLSGGAA